MTGTKNIAIWVGSQGLFFWLQIYIFIADQMGGSKLPNKPINSYPGGDPQICVQTPTG
jgi:hypothetical protein